MKILPSSPRLWMGLLAMAVGSLLGCRHDTNRELVERELRLQEDEIYSLQDELSERDRQLADCRREIDALRAEGGGFAPTSPAAVAPGASTRPAPAGRRNAVPDRPLAPPEPPTIELPDMEGPAPQSENPPKTDQSHKGVPGHVAQAAAQEEIPIENGRPDQIQLNRRLTGGFDADHRPGDEGVMVVFAPRDRHGRLVRASGAVSIAVVDPALAGSMGRVARWDFSAAESNARFQKTSFGHGFHFNLRWPARAPQNETLLVFVRFTPDGGASLEAGQRIQVELPPQAKQATNDSSQFLTEPHALSTVISDPQDPVRRQSSSSAAEPDLASDAASSAKKRRVAWSAQRPALH